MWFAAALRATLADAGQDGCRGSHGSRFDVTIGTALNGPATAALKVYAVQEAEGAVRVYV